MVAVTSRENREYIGHNLKTTEMKLSDIPQKLSKAKSCLRAMHLHLQNHFSKFSNPLINMTELSEKRFR